MQALTQRMQFWLYSLFAPLLLLGVSPNAHAGDLDAIATMVANFFASGSGEVWTIVLNAVLGMIAIAIVIKAFYMIMGLLRGA